MILTPLQKVELRKSLVDGEDVDRQECLIQRYAKEFCVRTRILFCSNCILVKTPGFDAFRAEVMRRLYISPLQCESVNTKIGENCIRKKTTEMHTKIEALDAKIGLDTKITFGMYRKFSRQSRR